MNTIPSLSFTRSDWQPIKNSTVIDIWALQSQPHLQPRATLPSNDSPSSSRVPSGEMRTPMLDDDTFATHGNGTEGSGTVRSVSSIPATASPSNAGQKHLTPAPKNWGEVVISPRRKKNKASPANGAGEIFDVLKVNWKGGSSVAIYEDRTHVSA